MKFTVIVPTMWRSFRILQMLPQLIKSDYIGEIIIIDNEPSKRLMVPEDPKITILEQDQNIYVNPAWNLGVSLAKEDYLCILNDDIYFDVDFGFSLASSFMGYADCIGIHEHAYKWKRPKLVKGHFIGTGWGCCMFLKKSGWIDIPDNIKIWYGDTWISQIYKEVWSVSFPIKTEMSTTSKDVELSWRIQEDTRLWNELKEKQHHD